MKNAYLASIIARNRKLTPFEKAVLCKTMEVKRGDTVTYAEIAELVGNRKASRAVGNALNKNPIPFFVPCHRVVSSSGLGGYKYGSFVKKMLLGIEKLTG